jgi:hypothetical protein
MSALAVPTAAHVDPLDALADVEATLAHLDDDQLGEAWQWIKDVSALIKARKMAADIAIRAKRIEARILRRLGVQPGMHASATFTARQLCAMSDDEFDKFLDDLGLSAMLYSDVKRWRDGEESRQRRHAAWERANRGDSDDFRRDGVMSTGHAAALLLTEFLADGEAVPTADAIEVLGNVFQVDPTSEPARSGLQNIITRAAASLDLDEDRTTRWQGKTDAPLLGRIPASVTFQLDGQWVRAAWGKASIEQLARNVEMVERQAQERMEAAEYMRGLLEQLRAVRVELGMDDIDDTAKAADVLMLARINGLIESTRDPKALGPERAESLFPRLFQHCDNYHAPRQHLANLAAALIAVDIPDESHLDEATATAIAPRLFTGLNRKSMEHFAAAYAPALVGTFGYAWEVVA